MKIMMDERAPVKVGTRQVANERRCLKRPSRRVEVDTDSTNVRDSAILN